jgi:hypothetical protein
MLDTWIFGSAVMIYCFKLSPEVWYSLVSECSVVLHVKFMFFSWHLVLFYHENLRMAGPNWSLVYVMPMGLRLLFIRYTATHMNWLLYEVMCVHGCICINIIYHLTQPNMPCFTSAHLCAGAGSDKNKP